ACEEDKPGLPTRENLDSRPMEAHAHLRGQDCPHYAPDFTQGLHSTLDVGRWAFRRFFCPLGRVAESGLRHSTRNRAWGNPPWVRIPPLPFSSSHCGRVAKAFRSCITLQKEVVGTICVLLFGGSCAFVVGTAGSLFTMNIDGEALKKLPTGGLFRWDSSWWLFCLLVLAIKILLLLLDPSPKLFMGDSGSYIWTALTGWIPPDLSHFYGYTLRWLA